MPVLTPYNDREGLKVSKTPGLVAFLLGLLPCLLGIGFRLLLAFSRVGEFLFAYGWHDVLPSGI